MNPLGSDFRKAMRRLTSAVSVISTAHDGARHGITVTSVTSVSMTPPSILFCVNRASRLRQPAGLRWRLLRQHPARPSDRDRGRLFRPCRRRRPFPDRRMGDRRRRNALSDPGAGQHLLRNRRDFSYGTHSIVIGKVREVAVARTGRAAALSGRKLHRRSRRRRRRSCRSA